MFFLSLSSSKTAKSFCAGPWREYGSTFTRHSLRISRMLVVFFASPQTNIINNNLRKSLQSSSVVDYVSIEKSGKERLKYSRLHFVWFKAKIFVYLSVCTFGFKESLLHFHMKTEINSRRKQRSARSFSSISNRPLGAVAIQSFSPPSTNDSYWILIQFQLIGIMQVKELERREKNCEKFCFMLGHVPV